MPASRSSLTALAVAVACSACSQGAAAASGSNGWSTHRDPAGFIVDVPPGWSLHYDATHRKVTLGGADGTRVVLRVVTENQALTQAEGAPVGEALAADADGAVLWAAGRLAGPTTAVIASRDGARVGRAFFTWQSTPSLSVGYLYAETAARDVLTRNRTSVARVFTSFRLVTPPEQQPGAAGGRPAPLSYRSFVEPSERMFSVELPAQWAVEGGIHRQSALDFRPAFRAALAGRAVIQSGDPSFPFFEVPNQMLQMGGFREGSWYSPGYGVRLLVRSFVDGTTFARSYAQSHFGATCAKLQFASARPRQDAVAQLNATFAQYGMPSQVSAGEAAFTCSSGGRPMQGYVFAATQLEMMGGAGIWNVQTLLSYLATPEYSAQAHAALQHAVATYRVDPAWAAQNAQTAKNISEITTRTGHEISQIIGDTYWSNSEQRYDAIEHYDRTAVRGHQLATDPLTNTQFEIDDRFANNFIDHSGHIVGSDVSALPGPEFRALISNP
jgi:hypothetical protein